ncbi:unnamed protein product [Camellia sinensis]
MPEVLHKHYGLETDVWTAGVILYILLFGVLDRNPKRRLSAHEVLCNKFPSPLQRKMICWNFVGKPPMDC